MNKKLEEIVRSSLAHREKLVEVSTVRQQHLNIMGGAYERGARDVLKKLLYDLTEATKPKPELFCHSLNEEDFSGSYDNREEAIAYAWEEAENNGTLNETECVYTGVHAITLVKGLGDIIAQTLRERAFDANLEDCIGSWLENPDVSDLDEEIESVVRHWLAKDTNTPPFFEVIAVQKHGKETRL